MPLLTSSSYVTRVWRRARSLSCTQGMLWTCVSSTRPSWLRLKLECTHQFISVISVSKFVTLDKPPKFETSAISCRNYFTYN